MASDKGFKQIVETWLRKYKVGTLPEHMRTAKPNSQDLMEIAKPTLIGIPILVILYLIWDLTGFATGLAVAVALAILDATRPLRGGYWLMKPEPPPNSPEVKNRFLLEEGIDPEKWWGKKVQEALSAHGVQARVVALDTSGASVDVYELEVQKGYDINLIAHLGDNFARSLALPKGERVLVEANIGNGRAALYIPKAAKRRVPSTELITQRTADFTKFKLPGLVGEDLVGKPLVVDIAQAPHLLVGGEVGSERASQLLNMLFSMAYYCSPQQLQMTVIDPKKIELPVVNQLPHLTEAVVTDIQQAYTIFKQVQTVLEQRCQLLLEAGVGHISAYNELNPEHPIPYYIVAISELHVMLQNTTPVPELGDIALGQAVRQSLMSLVTAAPAQAAGIHFLFGLQCYDPKTCGDMLRQAIPSAIGLRVCGQAFSEMLIGRPGCEVLGSHGQCYVLMSNDMTPVRAQVASATELEWVQLAQQIKEKWPN